MSDVFTVESLKRKQIALCIDPLNIRRSSANLIEVRKKLDKAEFMSAIDIAQSIAGDFWIWRNDSYALPPHAETEVIFLFKEPDHAFQFKLSV